MELKKSGEDYLEAILILQKQNGAVRSIDIAKHLGFAKSSVSYAVSALRDGGFLRVGADGVLHLTEIGMKAAQRIYERHHLLTQMLTAYGVDAKTAEQDACKMEHGISDESFEKLKTHFLRERAVRVDEPKQDDL